MLPGALCVVDPGSHLSGDTDLQAVQGTPRADMYMFSPSPTTSGHATRELPARSHDSAKLRSAKAYSCYTYTSKRHVAEKVRPRPRQRNV